jgi:hypothetical protein
MTAGVGVERNDGGKSAPVRSDLAGAEAFYPLPFALMFQAHSARRENFDPNNVERQACPASRTAAVRLAGLLTDSESAFMHSGTTHEIVPLDQIFGALCEKRTQEFLSNAYENATCAKTYSRCAV